MLNPSYLKNIFFKIKTPVHLKTLMSMMPLNFNGKKLYENENKIVSHLNYTSIDMSSNIILFSIFIPSIKPLYILC